MSCQTHYYVSVPKWCTAAEEIRHVWSIQRQLQSSEPPGCKIMLIKQMPQSLPCIKIFASPDLFVKSTLSCILQLNWLQLYPLLPFLFKPLTICAHSAQFKIQICWSAQGGHRPEVPSEAGECKQTKISQLPYKSKQQQCVCYCLKATDLSSADKEGLVCNQTKESAFSILLENVNGKLITATCKH